MSDNGELRRTLESEVEVSTGEMHLSGCLHVPEAARGIVVFAHGSGSSRHSPRNRFVARVLQEAGLGTLLMDLLTPAEEALDWQTGELRFDISFLSTRLIGAIDWLQQQPQTAELRVGCFGASTGAAAALIGAADRRETVAAVVSRGGRPDLAGISNLRRVEAPTLLIVGGSDHQVIELNQAALRELHCTKRLEVVPGATHLFEEPGALEQVARLAREWLVRHLGRPDEARAA